ncbi:cation diffusion facilitator family transporter [Nocardioides alcanivorans]|uniref:cation diffusion facilitator family transporter n=1 Tax=Nocardioides alcanivorans TaxID=2897352 RepID=UPI001F463750|nr:cation diffusion facilitator family transporter [Nocardioides alcanivorans]
MGHGHGHGHAASRAADRRRLVQVLAVTGTVLVIEVIGAWLTGSLALLADAGHMATDASAVLIALSASYVATRPAGPRATFGWHRFEVLAALVNAVVLLGVCGFLGWSAVRRLAHPTEVEGGGMLLFALAGLLANLVSLAILANADRTSLNIRGAFLEVLTDALGSVLAIVAGAVIWLTDWTRADAIATLLIALLILPRSLSLIRDAGAVLLETAPRDLDLLDVERHLAEVPGVVEVHDLHAWTITSGMPSLSAHVAVTDAALAERGVGAYLDELAACVADHFGIRHATFQVEPAGHRKHEDLGEAGC